MKSTVAIISQKIQPRDCCTKILDKLTAIETVGDCSDFLDKVLGQSILNGRGLQSPMRSIYALYVNYFFCKNDKVSGRECHRLRDTNTQDAYSALEEQVTQIRGFKDEPASVRL